MASRGSYSKVNHLDDETEEWRRKGPSWQRRLQVITVIVFGAIACGFVGFAAHYYAVNTRTNAATTIPTRELHCGNSSIDAQAQGCVFDLLTNNWMPQYCSDSVTDAEYRAWVMQPERKLGSWAFYHDDEAAHQVSSEEELSRLVGRRIYTTKENHLGHCTFLARRMHRLAIGEINAVAHNTMAHTIHCTSSILDALEDTEQGGGARIGSEFEVGVVSCLVEVK